MHALCWPGHGDEAASTASGGIRMRPPLGQKPWEQGLSQTERAISLRNAMHEGVPGVGEHLWQVLEEALTNKTNFSDLYKPISSL